MTSEPNYQALVANVMANLFRIAIAGETRARTNASLVMDVFAIGSTRAAELCRLYGLDPDEKLPAERHQEFWCHGCNEVVDSDIVSCHGCKRSICVDNCVFATNHEHGLYFCEECHQKNPPETEEDE